MSKGVLKRSVLEDNQVQIKSNQRLNHVTLKHNTKKEKLSRHSI